MPTVEEIEGVVRRCDWGNQTITILSHGVRTYVLPYDLTPRTPDYRGFVGMDVKCTVVDGKIMMVQPIQAPRGRA